MKDLTSKACDICQVGFDRTNILPERGLMIISCYGCSLSCHLYCYGIATPIQQDDEYCGYFQCDRCKVNQKKDQPCVVCHQQKGLKKLIEGTKGDFVHPVCGLFSRSLEVISFMDLKFRKSNTAVSLSTCSICKEKGGHIMCCQQECNKYAHFYCIMNDVSSVGGYTLGYAEKNTQSFWNMVLTSKELAQQGYFKGSHQDIKAQVKTKAKQIMKNFFTIQKENVDIDIDSVFEQFQSQEIMEEEKDGVIRLQCPEHKPEQEIYCKCQNGNSDPDMIQCESCTEWYHGSCLMTTLEFQALASQDKSYYCPFCIDWTQKRREKILKFSQVEYLSELLPPYLKMSIQTLIILGIYCERALTTLIQQYNEQLYGIVEGLLSNLPFLGALSAKVSQLQEKSHITDFMNFLFKQINYKTDCWKPLTQINLDGTPIQANITYNNKLKQRIDKVVKLFKDYDECQFYVQADKDLSLITVAYEAIKNKTKVDKEQMKQFKGDYNEFTYFQNQRNSYKTWKNDIIRTIQSYTRQIQDFCDDVDEDSPEGQIDAFLEHLQWDREKIKSEDNLKFLINSVKQSALQLKISAVKMHNLVVTQEFLFEVPWAQRLLTQIEEGELKMKEAEAFVLQYQDYEDIVEFVNTAETLPFYYKNNSQFYDLISKVDKFNNQFEELMNMTQSDEQDGEFRPAVNNNGFKITLEYLQQLLKLGTEIQVPAEQLEQLELIQNELEEFRIRVNEMIKTSGLNDQLKKKFNFEIQHNQLFDIPEIQQLQDRLNKLTEIEKIKSAKHQTLDQIKESLEVAIHLQFDVKIAQYFETELNKAQEIQTQTQNLLQKEIFSSDDLIMAQQIINNIALTKLILPEKEQLLNLTKAVTLIDQLYAFYLKHKSLDQEMEIETDKQIDLEYKINALRNPSNLIFNESPTLISELDAIIAKPFQIFDTRIKVIYEQYREYLNNQQIDIINTAWKNGEEISLQLVEQVLESQNPKLNDFKEQYLLSDSIVQKLLQEVHIVLLSHYQLSAEQWLSEIANITLNIRGGVWDQLRGAQIWAQIIQKYFELQPQWCTYDSLRALQETMILANMPKHSIIFYSVNQRISNFSAIVDKLKDYNSKREAYLEKTGKKTNQFKAKYGYQLILAEQLDLALNTCRIQHDYFSLLFTEDLKLIRNIKSALESKEEVDYAQLYKQLVNVFIFDQQTLDLLRIRIYTDKITEINNGHRTVDLQKAKKLYESISQLIRDYKIEQIDFFKTFEDIIHLAEQIQNLINKIRENKQYTFEEIQSAIQRIDKIRSIHIENSSDLEIIFIECQQCMHQVQEIQTSDHKVKENQVLQIHEKIQKLPLQKEQKIISDWIDAHVTVKQDFQYLKQQIKSTNKPNGKELKQLLDQFREGYNNSNIAYLDAEHFLQEYDEFQKKLEVIESNINDESSFDQFSDLLSLFRWGDQYERVKLMLWNKQVQNLKDGSSKRWGSTQLRNFLNQGYDIIEQLHKYGPKQNIDKLKAPILYLEQLTQKVLDHVMSTTESHMQTVLVENRIDPYDLTAELQHMNSTEKFQKVKELQPKKPFEDMVKFLEKRKTNVKKPPPQVQAKQAQALQRETVEPQNEKKVKIQQDKQSTSQVTQQIREIKKKELQITLGMNPVFARKDAVYIETRIKEIENQEFAEHHKYKNRYSEKMSKLLAMFQALNTCEYLSKKLIQRSFSQDCIALIFSKFESGQLNVLEQKLRAKNQSKSGQSNNLYNPLAVKSQLKPVQVTTIPTTKKVEEVKKPKDDLLSQIINDIPVKITPITSNTPTYNKQRTPSPLSKSSRSINLRQDSSDSDLPELKPDNQDAPILYNPDAADDQIPKMRVVIKEQTFGESIFKIGKRSKLIYQDKTFSVEFYTQIDEIKLKDLGKIPAELKHLKSQPLAPSISTIEQVSQKEHSLLVIGWIYPERYSEISEINKFAEMLKKERIALTHQLNEQNSVITICHFDNLATSQLFNQFQVQEFVSEAQFSRKENGIWKYWQNSTSKLTYVITIKNRLVSSLSHFTATPYEKIKNIIRSKDVQKWAESKILDYKSKQQQKIAPPPEQVKAELEPVTSEEENAAQDQDYGRLFEGLTGNQDLMQQLFQGTDNL